MPVLSEPYLTTHHRNQDSPCTATPDNTAPRLAQPFRNTPLQTLQHHASLPQPYVPTPPAAAVPANPTACAHPAQFAYEKLLTRPPTPA
jgi:hypothetical protein